MRVVDRHDAAQIALSQIRDRLAILNRQ